MNTAGPFLYRAMEWITRLAYINFLWVLFSLAGGLVLGLFPATTSMFAVIREWLKGNTDTPIFKSFVKFYKTDFWKSNLLGLMIVLMVFLLYADFLFIQYNNSKIISWAAVPFYMFGLFFFLFLLYVFPAFVHFDLKILHVMKNALLLMLINPLITLLIIVCLASVYVIMYMLPALFFLYGVSSYAFITMWLCYTAFSRASKRQSKVEE